MMETDITNIINSKMGEKYFLNKLTDIWDKLFDRIYIINNSDNIERRKNIINETKRVGIYQTNKVEIYEVINNPLKEKMLNCLLDNLPFDCFKLPYLLDVSYNHYVIQKEALKKGYKRILIIEDDICFLKDLEKLYNIIKYFPLNYDIVFLDKNNRNNEFIQCIDKEYKINDYFYKIKEGIEDNCSSAMYSLNEYGLKEITEYQEQLLTASDCVLLKIARKNKNIKICLSKTNCGIQGFKFDKNGEHSGWYYKESTFRNEYNCDLKNIIIIPTYKEKLEGREKENFLNNIEKMKRHKIVIVCPEQMDTSFYKQYDIVNFEFFDKFYFSCVKNYNLLLTNFKFYERFSQYDYMLIMHNESYVFYDALNEWCEKNYDYIGAPWLINGWDIYGKVGNGGFSLRKINSHLKAVKNNEKKIQDLIENNWNEDGIFAFMDDFKYPTKEEAALFSIETNPYEALLYTNGKTPFGSHNLYSYDNEVFKKLKNKNLLVNLTQRTGNQMFEVAASYKIAREHGFNHLGIHITNPWEIDEIRKIIFNKVNFVKLKEEEKEEWENVPKELNAFTNVSFDNIDKKNIILNDYFQDAKLIDKNICDFLFTPSKEIKNEISRLYGVLEYYVCVQVRRGDYLMDNCKDTYRSLTKEEIEESLKLFPSDCGVMFVSDDIEWCKENFKEDRYYFADKEGCFPKVVLDLYTQTECGLGNIISNSTFAWWGAYLNNHPLKKVVVHCPWYRNNFLNGGNNIIPDDWIKIYD